MIKRYLKVLSALLGAGLPVIVLSLPAVALPQDYVTVPDPTTGVLLGSQSITINGTQEFTPTSDPLGSIPDCGIVADDGNGGSVAHAYSLLPFTVSTAGDYTFRVVSSSPSMPDGTDSDPYNYGPYSSVMPPTGDLMMALYNGSIDLANDSDLGVLGCNDDSVLAGQEYDNYVNTNSANPAVYSQSGQYLNVKFPEFTVNNLPAGNYTILLTTWAGGYDMSSWQSQSFGNQTATFEFWGPQGGISSGIQANNQSSQGGSQSNDQTQLANTGYPINNVGYGLAITILGFALFMFASKQMKKN